MAPNPREILWSHTGELWDGWNGAPGTGALECGTGGKSRGGDLGKIQDYRIQCLSDAQHCQIQHYRIHTQPYETLNEIPLHRQSQRILRKTTGEFRCFLPPFPG